MHRKQFTADQKQRIAQELLDVCPSEEEALRKYKLRLKEDLTQVGS